MKNPWHQYDLGQGAAAGAGIEYGAGIVTRRCGYLPLGGGMDISCVGIRESGTLKGGRQNDVAGSVGG